MDNKLMFLMIFVMCVPNNSMVAMRQKDLFPEVTEWHLRRAKTKLSYYEKILSDSLEWQKVVRPNACERTKRFLLWAPALHCRKSREGHWLARTFNGILILTTAIYLTAVHLGPLIAFLPWFVLEPYIKLEDDYDSLSRALDRYEIEQAKSIMLEKKIKVKESEIDKMCMALECKLMGSHLYKTIKITSLPI